MNLLLAAIISIMAFVYCITTSSIELGYILNIPGLVIVGSGTAAAFLIGVGLHKIPGYLAIFSKINFGYDRSLKEIRQISEAYYDGQELPFSKYPLIQKGVKLLNIGLSQEELDELLLETHQNEFEKRIEVANFLSNLSKYPPALGMIGTVFSMIGVFANMGDGNDFQAIGVHIATAMLSTLYGLVLANYFISPLAERVTYLTQLWQNDQLAILKTFSNLAAGKSRVFTEENLEIYQKSA